MRAAVATLACASVITVGTLSTASASAGAIANAKTGGYSTQPAGTTDQLRDLGATVDVTLVSGQSEYMYSVLRVGAATTKTEVSQVLACRSPGAAHLLTNMLGVSESSQNVDASATAALTARFEFVPPDTGTYECSLDAVFVNHASTTSYGDIQVLTGSYVEDAKGPLVARAQAYTTSKSEVTTQKDVDLIASYSVPSSVSSLAVVGDVEVTNCYTTYYTCPAEGERDTDLTAQIFVQQLTSSGAVCQQTTSTLNSVAVTWDTHHQKIYNRVDNVPISSACSSRNVKVFVRMIHTGGNDFEIEDNNESNSFLFEES